MVAKKKNWQKSIHFRASVLGYKCELCSKGEEDGIERLWGHHVYGLKMRRKGWCQEDSREFNGNDFYVVISNGINHWANCQLRCPDCEKSYHVKTPDGNDSFTNETHRKNNERICNVIQQPDFQLLFLKFKPTLPSQELGRVYA